MTKLKKITKSIIKRTKEFFISVGKYFGMPNPIIFCDSFVEPIPEDEREEIEALISQILEKYKSREA